jgi:hypothetical protein
MCGDARLGKINAVRRSREAAGINYCEPRLQPCEFQVHALTSLQELYAPDSDGLER